MRASKPLVWLLAAGIVVWTIGAVVSFLTNGLLSGQYTTAAIVTTLLVVVATVAAAAVGAKNKRWLANPSSYW